MPFSDIDRTPLSTIPDAPTNLELQNFDGFQYGGARSTDAINPANNQTVGLRVNVIHQGVGTSGRINFGFTPAHTPIATLIADDATLGVGQISTDAGAQVTVEGTDQAVPLANWFATGDFVDFIIDTTANTLDQRPNGVNIGNVVTLPVRLQTELIHYVGSMRSSTTAAHIQVDESPNIAGTINWSAAAAVNANAALFKWIQVETSSKVQIFDRFDALADPGSSTSNLIAAFQGAPLASTFQASFEFEVVAGAPNIGFGVEPTTAVTFSTNAIPGSWPGFSIRAGGVSASGVYSAGALQVATADFQTTGSRIGIDINMQAGVNGQVCFIDSADVTHGPFSFGSPSGDFLQIFAFLRNTGSHIRIVPDQANWTLTHDPAHVQQDLTTAIDPPIQTLATNFRPWSPFMSEWA